MPEIEKPRLRPSDIPREELVEILRRIPPSKEDTADLAEEIENKG